MRLGGIAGVPDQGKHLACFDGRAFLLEFRRKGILLQVKVAYEEISVLDSKVIAVYRVGGHAVGNVFARTANVTSHKDLEARCLSCARRR
jgi:hypothetical protein